MEVCVLSVYMEHNRILQYWPVNFIFPSRSTVSHEGLPFRNNLAASIPRRNGSARSRCEAPLEIWPLPDIMGTQRSDRRLGCGFSLRLQLLNASARGGLSSTGRPRAAGEGNRSALRPLSLPFGDPQQERRREEPPPPLKSHQCRWAPPLPLCS